MRPNLLFLCCFLGAVVSSAQSNPDCGCTHPFPYKTSAAQHPKAPHYIPLVGDTDVTNYYVRWRGAYLKRGSAPDNCMIQNDEGGKQKEYSTTSEAMSYGMMIVVLMAGYDTAARLRFDSLYRYVKAHPTAKSKFLMAWAQHKDTTQKDDDDSAVDGDLDIAYALLLAYKQWNDDYYRRAADSVLAAIVSGEIDTANLRIVRGNASVPSDLLYHVIRTSDFMPAEFRSFYLFTGKSIWLNLLKKNYTRYVQVQKQFSPAYGMFPDYIDVLERNSLSLVSKKVPRKLLKREGIDDGGNGVGDNRRGQLAGFNSCRVPWRIATDYLLNGDDSAKKILEKVNAGAKRYAIDSVCWLANVMIPSDNLLADKHKKKAIRAARHNSADLSTIGPLCVSALGGGDTSSWLPGLLGLLTEDPTCRCYNNDNLEKPDYYDNTIRMVCLLLLSKNYWLPED